MLSRPTIVGTWVYDSVSAEVETNKTENDIIVRDELIDEFSGQRNSTIVLTSDGKVTWTQPLSDGEEGPSIGTYTWKNNVLTMTWGDDDFDSYSTILVNNKLALLDDYTDEYKDRNWQGIIAAPENLEIKKAIAILHMKKSE